jgi:hypothetical protein
MDIQASIPFKFTKPTFPLLFNFRRVDTAKGVTKLEGKEYTETKDGTKTYLTRKAETHNFTAIPDEIAIPAEAIEAFLVHTLVYDNWKSLVDQGITPKSEETNLSNIIAEYLAGGSDVRKFSKEFRTAVANKFAEWAKGAGKGAQGIEVMRTLLAGGFHTAQAQKYIDGLEKIKGNLVAFISAASAEDQETYADYITAMVEKIDAILNPTEVIKIEELGL